MATIRKLASGKWQVRWRWPRGRAGQERSRTCPDKRTAERLRLQVEQALAAGHDWEPERGDPAPAPPPPVDLDAMLAAWLVDRQRCRDPRTCLRYAESVAGFLRWLRAEGRSLAPHDALSRKTLGEWWTYLRERGGRALEDARLRGRREGREAAYDALADAVALQRTVHQLCGWEATSADGFARWFAGQRAVPPGALAALRRAAAALDDARRLLALDDVSAKEVP